jgi:hypothetical protein
MLPPRRLQHVGVKYLGGRPYACLSKAWAERTGSSPGKAFVLMHLSQLEENVPTVEMSTVAWPDWLTRDGSLKLALSRWGE